MSFHGDIRRFIRLTENRQVQIHREVGVAIHRSIVLGDPATGSPGQPVDEGALKGSWQKKRLAKLLTQSTSNAAHARPIEEGIGRGGRPMTLRSKVGGFHSVKLTRAGFPKLVRNAFKKVMGG